MTAEEAINILTDGDWWNYLENFVAVTSKPRKESFDEVDTAIAALRAQQKRESNKPLTLDELREASDCTGCANEDHKEFCIGCIRHNLKHHKDLYRHKPKGESK